MSVKKRFKRIVKYTFIQTGEESETANIFSYIVLNFLVVPVVRMLYFPLEYFLDKEEQFLKREVYFEEIKKSTKSRVAKK